tara:strand:- start:497 stop:601 length:105 start_codon:yes stop_codon:yes gene_type:complete
MVVEEQVDQIQFLVQLLQQVVVEVEVDHLQLMMV